MANNTLYIEDAASNKLIISDRTTSKMLSLFILSAVCTFVFVSGSDMMGPGRWDVNSVHKCEEQYHKFKFVLSQEKINRTHDGFNAYMLLDEEFTENYAIRVDICKWMDGGCKPFQVMSDNCCANFVNKYAKNNVRAALALAGVDPPQFPIGAGEYDMKGYVFDYNELPSDGAYGEFVAKVFILDGTLEVGCLEVKVEFKEVDEDEE